ncbi:hypothetical protein [Sphaerisporangium perillae]|uniref:hypothetical protein n=1 Tax=Sphaerisporangium perillae TaxID=2935860 RepID=UPI00200EA409|nr:hypothetical protein [Sphaerisporangium perillae]
MMTTDPSARTEFIAGLRRLADFLAANPKVPIPAYGTDIQVNTFGTDSDKRAAVDRIAELIASPATDGTTYETTRDFGPITYRAAAVWDDTLRDWHALVSYDGAVTA